MSWGKIAAEYIAAKKALQRNDIVPMKTWNQKRMGQVWRQEYDAFRIELQTTTFGMGDEWEECGYITRDKRLTANKADGVIKLAIMSVDVQMDHFYFVVRLASIDGKSRLLDCGKVNFWEDISNKQGQHGIHPQFVFVDSGYGKKGEVYELCAKHGWTALKGDGMRDRFAHKLPNGKTIHKFYSEVTKAGTPSGKIAKLFHFSDLNIKDMLDRMRRDNSRWQIPSNAPKEYLESLESERRLKKPSGIWLWDQIGKRPNHYWDCEVMITAVMVMAKIIGSVEEAETTG
jgi:hypothetical protein